MINGAPGLRKQEFQKENFIFHDAIHLAIEVAEASGGSLPTEAQFDLLYQNGYIAYASDEVVSIFYGWQDYHQVAATYYEDFLDEKDSKKREILETIQIERQLGRLPDKLFKTREHYRAVDENGETLKGNHAIRYSLTEEDASEITQLSRYAKYGVLEHLLRGCNGQEMTDENKLNIVLGFTQATGKAKTSFIGAIRSARPEISVADIENAVELLGFYEYIYPKSRKSYLEELLHAAGSNLAENSGINHTAESTTLETEKSTKDDKTKPEIYYDLTDGKLIIGRLALESYLFDYGSFANVQELEALLISDDLQVESFARPHISRKWSNQDMVNYGQWIVGLIEPGGHILRQKTLKRAYELGLGPHPDTMIRKNRFLSLKDYFKAIDFKGRSRYKQYDDWEFEDFVKHIKNVIDEIGVTPTRAMLSQRIKEGHDEPSPKIIDKVGGLSNILESAGLNRYNKKTDRNSCIERGIHFFNEFGRLPNAKDIDENSDLPSRFPVNKYCGGVRSYQQMILQRVSNTIEEEAA
jgi:hypothetical protein